MAFDNPPSDSAPGYGGPPPGYPQQPAVGPPGYPPQAYPQPGYPQPGYAPQGYPQPGYAPPGYGFQPPVPRPPRPSSVSLAVLLQFGLVALALLNMVMAFVVQAAVQDTVGQRLRDLGATAGTTHSANASAGFAIAGSVCVGLVMITVYTLLAVFNLRGSNVSRIFTWIVSGLALCWGVGSAAVSAAALTAARDTLAASNLAGFPTWIMVYTWSYVALTALLHIAIVVLLAFPASNAYFNPKPR